MANDLRLTTTEQAVHSLVHGARQNLDLARVEMVNGLPGSENGQNCSIQPQPRHLGAGC